MKNKVWVISEVYYPDEQGTAYFMTKLAEGLSHYFDVYVLCGYPTVTARGNAALKKEVFNGVKIERCQGTTFNKDSFALRVINILTNGLSVFFKALFKIKSGDIVLVVTGPHILHFLVKLSCFLKGVKCILRVDDVYPEALIATDVLNQKSLVASLLFYMNQTLYRSMNHIVVLGRDMKELATNKLNGCGVNVSIIPNWADIDQISPQSKKDNELLKKLNLNEKFVVQCAGNMGRAQGIENMFTAAELLKNNDDIHFLFIGGGIKRGWMEDKARRDELANVTILDQMPRAEQHNFLNACDIAMASLLPMITGAGVPSRMYNIMAAGRPIIAIAGSNSELSMVVEEERIGWVVIPDKPKLLAEVILEAKSNPIILAEMGRRARMVAETKYSSQSIVLQYKELIDGIFRSETRSL